MVTAAFATSAGDIICQRLEKQAEWDKPRTLRMFVVGSLFGPILTVFHSRVERLFPGKSAKRVSQKVFANILLSPCLTSINFGGNILMQGKGLAAVKEKIEKDLPSTFIKAAMYWPFVATLQFKLIPLAHRAYIAAGASVVWNIYLSYMNNKDSVRNTIADTPSFHIAHESQRKTDVSVYTALTLVNALYYTSWA
eukprot:CFRG7233T1